ncbi:hypothetical protein [Streptomyces sp. ODS05-4]|uniref:hypothetical protein n=1 Tax=Streptomyces sp. ODS05-4 TaxID=2944939 RepID=UPI0027E5652C|nr:hypothetical protein [Streptomyces sp. ODS05-4]
MFATDRYRYAVAHIPVATAVPFLRPTSVAGALRPLRDPVPPGSTDDDGTD